MSELNSQKNKIWVINMDEAVDNLGSRLAIEAGFLRYSLLVRPGDYFIILPNSNKDFLKYVSNVNKLGDIKNWTLELSKLSSSEYIVDSIMSDNKIISKIINISQSNQYFIEPYIATYKIKKLSELTKVPLAKHAYTALKDENHIKFNDKYFFKIISEKMEVNTIKYLLASNKEELIDTINKLSNSYEHLIIKKAFSAGGFGNLIGSRLQLISSLDKWINNEKLFIVEPFINIKLVLGSLVFVTNSSYNFMFIDKQRFNNYIWSGCTYPYINKNINIEIEKQTLKYAEYMLERGIEGYLNIDWALVDEKGENKIYALEANYRYNGFIYVLDLAKNIFGLDYHKAVIDYNNYYKINPNIKNMNDLISKLDIINNKFSTSNRGGIISTNTPVNQTVGILMVSDTNYAMKELINLSKSLLID